MIFNLLNNFGNILNQKIIGGTEIPINPRENTFWVNTDINIPNYIFDFDEPVSTEEVPVKEGTVWMMTEKNGYLKVNILTNGAIYIYPIDCKQYISGEWVRKNVKVYLNGEWHDLWTGQLFDNGNQYVPYTGGWATNRDESNIGYHVNRVSIENEIIFTSVYLGDDESYSDSTADAYTVNKIDITNYNKLYIRISASGSVGEYSYVSFGIGSVGTGGSMVLSHSMTVSNDSDVVLEDGAIAEFDISSYSGEYNVGLTAKNLNGATIDKVWLEA